MKNKKLLLIVLIMVLIVSIGKETYALFTNEVSSIVQNYSTGTLKLSYSNASINLDNAYPLTDEDGMNMSNSTITITNVGTLAYKFNVILDPSNDSTISSDLIRVSMDGESPATLSTDGNIIIRDVILNPGSSRTFTIKLWINGSASSTDILNKNFSASLTSTGIAAKNVEDDNGAVLAGPNKLYNYIKKNADTTTQIDFSQTSEASNTNGIYMTTDTDSGKPVYYYRGNVDNHLLFANFCWRIVRTTETGGVKIIYDGTPTTDTGSYDAVDQSKYTISNDTTWPFIYDSKSKTWKSKILEGEVDVYADFSDFEAGSYQLEISVHNDSNEDEVGVLLDGKSVWTNDNANSGTVNLDLTSSSVVRVYQTKWSMSTDGSDYIEFTFKKETSTCENTTDIITRGFTYLNYSRESLAYVGYMYGTVYNISSKNMSSLTGQIVYGNDITYNTSTNKYTLVDTYTSTGSGSTNSSTIASKYHYTCFTSSNTCENVNYIVYTSSSHYTYFELSQGKNHLDILKEMLDNSTNENNSDAKYVIDDWYKSNLIKYASQLEDTVFCNDRSYDISKTGWNKDYSNSENALNFGTYQRLVSNKSPRLACPNANDKFTVEKSNGNGALTYPVSLLTIDEIVYAGGVWRTGNSSYYLNNGMKILSISPYNYTSIPEGFFLDDDGSVYEDCVDVPFIARPVISLKPGTIISGGTGTATSPFIVG